ncbi:hypothetical protein [Holdemania sp. Marseille-P2844]|jgi:DNA-directed RNA polymerase specialized sigma24 family protein|uniref:hypothetical protein n=1 Tax=Holdemania sp. Marseille-P2844 TaxID=1852366 RepID=UPI0009340B74|nr:hypothetical protein [Holdemania sp. Marseille-P2844]
MVGITESEYKQRFKKKLWLYGSYTREIEKLQRRFFEIQNELHWHCDFPKAAARSCRVGSPDPKHPAEQQLIIEYTSLEYLIEEVAQERSYLGLDDFMAGLDPEDRELIKQVYVEEKSYREIGYLLPRSKSNVGYRINQLILETWDTSH